MTDYYMDFKDKETFESLKGAVPFEYGPEGTVQSAGWDIDIIGDGELRADGWDKDGEPIMKPVGGFLVNLRSNYDLPKSILEFRTYPENPVRVWA